MTTPPDREPNWRDNPDALDRLCENGAQQLCDPIDPRLRDLLGQGPSLVQLHTIIDVPITHQEYL